jgi:hypothetical protein
VPAESEKDEKAAWEQTQVLMQGVVDLDLASELDKADFQYQARNRSKIWKRSGEEEERRIAAEEAMSRCARNSTTPTTHQFTELTAQTVLGALPAQAYRRVFEMARPRVPPRRESDTANGGQGHESRNIGKHRRCATPARKATTFEQWSDALG